MPADLADSLKTQDRPCATRPSGGECGCHADGDETNLRQGDLGVEVDGMKGDLTETENHFSGGPGVVRVGGISARRAGAVACLSKHRRQHEVDVLTAPRQCCGGFFWIA